MNLTVKNLKNYFSLTLFLSLITLMSSATYANVTDDKTTLKAREAVENASPDDWMTYAKSAEKCMKKNVNLKEAAEWLDKSIAIKSAPYNQKLKGLYYEKNNLTNEAINCYVESLKLGLENDINYSDEETQLKLQKLMGHKS